MRRTRSPRGALELDELRWPPFPQALKHRLGRSRGQALHPIVVPSLLHDLNALNPAKASLEARHIAMGHPLGAHPPKLGDESLRPHQNHQDLARVPEVQRMSHAGQDVVLGTPIVAAGDWITELTLIFADAARAEAAKFAQRRRLETELAGAQEAQETRRRESENAHKQASRAQAQLDGLSAVTRRPAIARHGITVGAVVGVVGTAVGVVGYLLEST